MNALVQFGLRAAWAAFDLFGKVTNLQPPGSKAPKGKIPQAKRRRPKPKST